MNILDEAKKLVDNDRQNTYGTPDECIGLTAKIFNTMSGHKLSKADVVMFNVAQKIARLRYKYKRDSIIDIVGYLYIWADKLKKDILRCDKCEHMGIIKNHTMCIYCDNGNHFKKRETK